VFHRYKGLPDGWREIVEQGTAVWGLLDDDERDLVAENADWLLRHKHWEASNGFALDDTITVTIAVQGGLLVLGRSVDDLSEVGAIIVYPTAMSSGGLHAGPASGTLVDGPLPVLGEAHDRHGPVLLAWDEAQAAAAHLGRGENVVLHELAHKVDMLDGMVDGTPPISRDDLPRWVEVCTDAFDALRAGVDRPPLRPYGATNTGEFFAVATEAFFDVPEALRAHEPALYEVLQSFYAQDPAGRAGRAPRP
jgi:Mlc titration factor MtfA (ptsG expression regulator)